MSQIDFRLKEWFFLFLWTIWVDLQRAFFAFSNLRPCYFIKWLVHSVYKNKIWNTSLINPYLIWRVSFQNMFTSCCNCYVRFLVNNNAFSNNFKYPHGPKSQSNYGSMSKKFFYRNIVSFKAYLIRSKKTPGIWVLHNNYHGDISP